MDQIEENKKLFSHIDHSAPKLFDRFRYIAVQIFLKQGKISI